MMGATDDERRGSGGDTDVPSPVNPYTKYLTAGSGQQKVEGTASNPYEKYIAQTKTVSPLPVSDVSTLGTYGETFGQAVKGVPAAMAEIYEGSSPYSEVNLADTLQENRDKRQEAFEAEPGGEQKVLGGLATAKDIKGQARSWSTSLASLAPAAGAGAALGFSSPVPGGALIGAGLAGLGSYYATKRAEENQFVRQYVENEDAKRKKRGLPALTQGEKTFLQDKLVSTGDVNKIGHAGAAPEIAASALEAAIALTPVKKLAAFLPKGATAKALTTGIGKAGAIGATEVGTEGVTRNLQQPIHVRHGLEEGPERDPFSVSDLATSTAEVAKPTLIGVLPMAGLGGGVGGYKAAKSNKEPEDLAEEPEDLAEEPEDLAEEPEDLAEEPEDLAEEPEDLAEEPEDLAEEPEDLAEDLAEEPEDLAEKTVVVARESAKTDIASKIPENPGVLGKTVLSGLDSLQPVLEAEELALATLSAIPSQERPLAKIPSWQLAEAAQHEAANMQEERDLDEESPPYYSNPAQTREAENALEKPETSPFHGDGGARPEISEAIGNPPIGSEGVQPSGQGIGAIEPPPSEAPTQQQEITDGKSEDETTKTGSPEERATEVSPKTRPLRGNLNPPTIKKLYEREQPVLGDTFVTPQGNTWVVEDISETDGVKGPKQTKTLLVNGKSGRKIEIYTDRVWDGKDRIQDFPIDEAVAKEHPLSDANDYEAAKEPELTKKAFVNFQDLPIAIENPKGSERTGIDENGDAWSTVMQDHYGEIKAGEGADGDAVDVFIPEGMTRDQVDSTDTVFVVDQVNPETKEFDEHKVMLGYPDIDAATIAYSRNYDAGWGGLGSITEMPLQDFKNWLISGDKAKPINTAVDAPPSQTRLEPKDSPTKTRDSRGGGTNLNHFSSAREAITHLVAEFGDGILHLITNKTLFLTHGKSGWPEGSEMYPDAEGVYDGGLKKIYIDLDATPKNRIVAVVLHEIGEHYNLRRILGSKNYAALQNQIKNRAKIAGSSAEKVWNGVARDYKHLEVGGEDFVAEVIAKLGEYAPDAPWYRRLLAKVKAFLIERGFGKGFVTGTLTETDLHYLLRVSLRSASRTDKQGVHLHPLILAHSLRIRGDKESKEDFIIPETPTFHGDLTGVLAYTPASAVSKGVERLPIKLRVGEAPEKHKGFGIRHIADSIEGNRKRAVPRYTSDAAENYARHVYAIANRFDQILKHGGRFVLRSTKMGEALIISKQKDILTSEKIYSVVSIVPANTIRDSWGAPIWTEQMGRTEQGGGKISPPKVSPKRNKVDRFSFSLRALDERSPEWSEWFKGSKMRRNGNPIKFYHGSKNEFTVYDKDKIATNTTHSTAGLGHFFTEKREEAARYGGKVHEVYLSVKNPYVTNSWLLDDKFADAEGAARFRGDLQGRGFDGVYIKDAGYAVPFESDQIKLTTTERPSASRDIRFSIPREHGLQPTPRFYSALRKAIEKAPEKILGNPQQVKAWLVANAPKYDVKKDEVYWSGVTDWLDAKDKGEKISRDVVLAFLDENGVKTVDIVLGDPNTVDPVLDRLASRVSRAEQALEDLSEPLPDDYVFTEEGKYEGEFYEYFDEESYREDYRDFEETQEQLEWELSEAERDWDTYEPIFATRHDSSTLTLPGGAAYRELVVTVPTIKGYLRDDETHFGDVSEGKHIGWIRYNTRSDMGGGSLLFLEELQSQRSQEARKKGFGVVPPAPFVTDSKNKATDAYISLLLKKAISVAIDRDLSSVSWTTGDQQADRYDLSAEIHSIRYSDYLPHEKPARILYMYRQSDEPRIVIHLGADNRVEGSPFSMAMEGKPLEDVIGVGLASKIINDLESGVIEGDGLKVGGEWAHAMYGDENGLNAEGRPALITQAAMEIARKMGGKMGTVEIRHRPEYALRDGITGVSSVQPALIITDMMREKISTQGMPLFSLGGRGETSVIESLTDNELFRKFHEMSDLAAREKLGFLSVRQIAEIAKRYLPGLKEYVDAMQRRRAKVDPFLHEASLITNMWKRLGKDVKKAVGRVMQQSTLNDIDVSVAWSGVRVTGNGQFEAYSQTTFHALGIKAIKQASETAGGLTSNKNSATFATEGEATAFLSVLEKIDRTQTERRARNRWKDPNIGRKKGYLKTKKEFDSLPDDGKSIYRETHALHTKIFRQRVQALEDRILEAVLDRSTANELIAQMRLKFESQSLSWYYAPLKRFGNYWFYGKDANGDKWFSAYESTEARRRAIVNFEAGGGTIRNVGTSLQEGQTDRIGEIGNDNFIRKVQDIVADSGLTREVSSELQDDIYQLYLSTLPDVSVRHNSRHRKGTKGYTEDAMRVFASSIHHGAAQLANMTEGRAMAKALSDAEKALNLSQNAEGMVATETEIEAATMLAMDWKRWARDGALEYYIKKAGKTGDDPMVRLYTAALSLRDTFKFLDMGTKVRENVKKSEKSLVSETTRMGRSKASQNLKAALRLASDWGNIGSESGMLEHIRSMLQSGSEEDVRLYKDVNALWKDLADVEDPKTTLTEYANAKKALLDAAKKISPENNSKAAYAIAELNKSYRDMVNTNSTGMDVIASYIRQFDFVMTMGLGLSSNVINSFQTPTVAMPVAVGKYPIKSVMKAFGNTRNEFLKAIFKMHVKGKDGKPLYRDEDGNVSITQVIIEKIRYAEERGEDLAKIRALQERLQALNSFKEEGDVSRTNFFDIIGIGKEGEQYGGALQDINKVLGWMFHHGERMNREISLMAAYDLARNEKSEGYPDGMPHQGAMDYARWLNNTAHGDYTSENAARIFRGAIPGVVMQYKKYPQAMFYLWGKSVQGSLTKWKEMPEGTEAEVLEKKRSKQDAQESARVLSALFLMQGAAAGLFGFPLMGIVVAVLNQIGEWVSDDDEPWDIERNTRVVAAEWGGETFATALTKGLGNAFTGVNLASRMNLKNVYFQEPLKDLEGKDLVSEYLSQVAGPFGGMLKKIFGDGLGYLSEGEIFRAVESASPKAIGDVLKAVRIAKDEYRSRNDDFLKDASSMEVLLQAIGFGSSEMEELYSERAYVLSARNAIQEAREKTINKIAREILGGKPIPAGIIVAWNKRNPTWPIGRESIIKSVKGTLHSQALQGGRGYSVEPRLAYLYDEYDIRDEE